MKTILAFGDSLTWGTDALAMRRHAHADQWPAVLEAKLGGQARVANAGLGGRTTMFDDHGTSADRNGARTLPTFLGVFEPLDLVIFMLGTNDIKPWVGGSPIAAGQGIKRLVDLTRTYPYESGSGAPAVLILSPPRVLAHGPSDKYPLLSPRAEVSHELAPVYRRLAGDLGCGFFDAATVATAEGGGDGVHLNAAQTRAIGEALAPVVAGLLGLQGVT